MKRLLAVSLIGLWPSTALAHTDLPPHHMAPKFCGKAIHLHAKPPDPTMHCLAGTITQVDDTGMKLDLVKGPVVKVVFTEKTVLKTDSAMASLQGLLSGDFACATTITHDHVITALTIVFDTQALACLPPRRSRAGSGSNSPSDPSVRVEDSPAPAS
jgi:hypothetical protein